MRYIIEERSQKSVGSGRNKFGGPDRYVAVQCVPDGVEPLKALSRAQATKCGITIEYFGEGYSKHRGPKSALGQARAAAETWVAAQRLPASVETAVEASL